MSARNPTPKRADKAVRAPVVAFHTSGSPVIWEVLLDDSGGELVFVSQWLELAVMKAFGSPLAGRRFAIEPDLETAPNAIMARVIEDGPVPWAQSCISMLARTTSVH